MVDKMTGKSKAQSTAKRLPASPRTAAKSKGTTGTRGASRKRSDRASEIGAEERRQLIAEAAYYRAERRGFRCRCSEHDWFDAEAEVDRVLAQRA
jgi:hypothetical protein